jgi:hypothetical protein
LEFTGAQLKKTNRGEKAASLDAWLIVAWEARKGTGKANTFSQSFAAVQSVTLRVGI